jgi:hypothetical protein
LFIQKLFYLVTDLMMGKDRKWVRAKDV